MSIAGVPPVLLPKVRSTAIMQAANGMPCSLRLPGICNHDPRTTVYCHLPGIGKSHASKVSDLHGAFGCSNCHQAIDQHTYSQKNLTDAMVLDAMLRGLGETQSRLIALQVIKVKGAKIV
jgi:hypothetical protein